MHTGEIIEGTEMNYLNQIICGSSLDVLKQYADNSVDCVVTDPPYQLDGITRKASENDYDRINKEIGKFNRRVKTGFMGKEWDVLPAVDLWREVLRVMKHGSFLFCMCTPRQDSLLEMLLRLREAGFMIATSSIYWTYASGFPKSENMSKAIDRRAGAKREVVGKKQYERTPYKANGDKGGSKAFSNDEWDDNVNSITAPSTPLAKQYDGAYTLSLKPAVEVIIVAMKPLDCKTYLDQCLKNGKGIVWLDDVRVPANSDTRRNSRGGENGLLGSDTFKIRERKIEQQTITNSRFPANLLVSDDALNDDCEHKTHKGTNTHYNNTSMFGIGGIGKSENDSGSFSRYFDLDAWFESAIAKLPESVQRTFPFLIVPKASKGEKNKGCEGLNQNKPKEFIQTGIDGRGNEYETKPRGNNHPTCKPIKLMMYLITLGSRPNDVILDPFCGSGTTCIAAKILGRQYIGIEREKDYHEIAQHRILAWHKSMEQQELFTNDDKIIFPEVPEKA